MTPSKRYPRSLFIFRRDLRCDDNTALIRALEDSEQVIACFIFDPRQTQPHPYRSEPAFAFMIQSLEDLGVQLLDRGGKLFYFQGIAHEVIEQLILKEKISAVYLNEDYTPFSVGRDLAIKKLCSLHNIAFYACADALLNDPRSVTKNAGGVYTVFTPFFRKSILNEVLKPAINSHSNYFNGSLKFKGSGSLPSMSSRVKPIFSGGRKQALEILSDLKRFKSYETDRDIPAQNATTGLSAHHKFGTCSVRETYHAVKKQLGKEHTLIRELYWRDFFTQIAYHFPHVFGHAFYEEYDGIQWSCDEEKFKLWREGRTGFPIVDAGMRELNATGFMHNRVRMITSSFLVKDLHIDWRWGEKYFAQRLVDYDPCVNNGNWQWVASTGCDHQPYFRIFNPWLQQKRFDGDCRYIKKWIPELKHLNASAIHVRGKGQGLFSENYPDPMLEHDVESQKAKEMFKAIKRRDE
jgi:deoxyribodipyrimidine photo-lyase